MRQGLAVAAALLGLFLASPAVAAKPNPHVAIVVLDKLAFGPIPQNLRVGDSVLWNNRDLFRHSATAKGHFDIDLPPGARRRMILRRAGVFPFACKFHPGMTGVLKVGP